MPAEKIDKEQPVEDIFLFTSNRLVRIIGIHQVQSENGQGSHQHKKDRFQKIIDPAGIEKTDQRSERKKGGCQHLQQTDETV